MVALVLAEHNNQSLHPATRHAVTAAQQIGGEIHILVAGANCDAAAKQAAAIAGVSKVLVSDAPVYAWPLAENVAPLIASIASPPSPPASGGGGAIPPPLAGGKGGNLYTHILATSTTTARDIMPRAAALLGVGQVSDIMQVISPDTFVRPIYAGNALETVQAKDAIKVITVRRTAFAAAGDSPPFPPRKRGR